MVLGDEEKRREGGEWPVSDVKKAFLQDIYVSQAEGFKSKEHPDYVYCL